MKDNKAAQTIVGTLVLYVLFKLWMAGVFSQPEESEGFSGPELWASLFAIVLSFIQLTGLITISIALKLLPAFVVMLSFISKSLQSGLEKAKSYVVNSKTESGWDWRPLAAVILTWMLWSQGQLSNLWDRVIDLAPDAVDVINVDKPLGILFSVDEDSSTDEQLLLASSIGVERLLSEKNIERRVLSSLQDAGTSEPWVQHAVDVAPDGQSSMIIVWPNGQAEVKKIPSSLARMQEAVSGW